MAIMAQWRTMRWEVSTRVLSAITSISASRKLIKEQGNDRDGSNPTNVKGFEPQSIPIEYTVAKAAGADPRVVYEQWKAQTGKKGTLLLGGKRFGPPTLQLDEVRFEASEISGSGDILVGKISLSFVQEGKPKKTASAASTGKAASGIAKTSSSASVPTGKTALKVGPTAVEKKAKLG